MARPTLYSDQLDEAICARLADGESLLSICRDDQMPTRQTIYNWLKENTRFFDNYAQARELGADAEFDELDEIALLATPEDVQVARLRIDTLKWKLSRKFPKKYGDKVHQELSGPDGKPIQHEVTAKDVESALKDIASKL